MSRTPFLYSGFWDAPLGVVARYKGWSFYFSREFDEEVDEYETEFRVFLLPEMSDDDIRNQWGRLMVSSLAFLGHVPVSALGFAPKFIHSKDADNEMDTEILEVLLSRIPKQDV